MVKTKKDSRTLEQFCFLMFLLYVAAGYFANDVIIPSKINSLVLFTFLAVSAFMILSRWSVRWNPIITWGLICLALALAAMLYSPSFSILGGTYYSLIVNFILVFILTQFNWDKKRLDAVFSVFTLSGALLIVLLFITGNLEDESGRLGEELTGNANILAIMLMMSAIYGLWLIVSAEKLSRRLIFIICEIFIYAGMFLSGGRKYIVVPLVFLFVLLMYKTDNNGRRHIVKYSLMIIVLFVVLYFLVMKVPAFYDTIGYRFEGVFALFDDSYDVDGSTDVRMRMIEGGLKEWIYRPIFGHGFDSFKYFNRDFLTGEFYYSHNNFVELLYNQGVVGFFAYYFIYAYLIYKARKKVSKLLSRGFVFGALLTLLLFDLFEVTYSITPAQFFLFFSYTVLKQEDV